MRSFLVLFLLVATTACAHSPDTAAHVRPESDGAVTVAESNPADVATPAPSVRRPLARPDAAYHRRDAFGRRTAGDEQLVSIPLDGSGMSYPELFALVSREAGIRIRFETHNQILKNKRVTMVGATRVPRGDLIAWAQDTCAYDGLILVPHGPADRREYATIDLTHPSLTTHSRFVTEDDLGSLAGRSGLYVSCVLSIPDGLDSTRARQALSQQSTKLAGLGRINELDKGANALMVSDFATVVANMRRSLDEMAIGRYEFERR